MTVFRQVVPNSTINANNARFEYYLTWLSVEGGVRSWLFSHTRGDREDAFDGFIIEGLDNIRSVPSMERTVVNARTQSMDAETFDYVKSIFASNRIYQVAKDGTKTPIGLKPRSVMQDNTLKEFEIKIKFMYQEADILNV